MSGLQTYDAATVSPKMDLAQLRWYHHNQTDYIFVSLMWKPPHDEVLESGHMK